MQRQLTVISTLVFFFLEGVGKMMEERSYFPIVREFEKSKNEEKRERKGKREKVKV